MHPFPPGIKNNGKQIVLLSKKVIKRNDILFIHLKEDGIFLQLKEANRNDVDTSIRELHY
jgi:hypothetical protein